MVQHLKNHYWLNIKDAGSDDKPLNKNTDISSFISSKANPTPMPIVGKTIMERLQLLLIRWLVTMYISLNVVENPFFRDLLKIFNLELVKQVPQSHNTVKGWIMDAFQEKKNEIKEIISNLKNNIHLSFDLWTLDNGLALIGVIAYFADKDYRLRTIMLALRRIKGSHSGENIAYTLQQIIKEFEITDRLGYFVLRP